MFNTCFYKGTVLFKVDVCCFSDTLSKYKPCLQTPSTMDLLVRIMLMCLCNCVIGKQSAQQKKLESLKSLIFNNSKASMTLNSTDLKQLLRLSRSSLGIYWYIFLFSFLPQIDHGLCLF